MAYPPVLVYDFGRIDETQKNGSFTTAVELTSPFTSRPPCSGMHASAPLLLSATCHAGPAGAGGLVVDHEDGVSEHRLRHM